MSQDEVEEVLGAELSEFSPNEYGLDDSYGSETLSYEFRGTATAEANNILSVLSKEKRDRRDAERKETVSTTHGEFEVSSGDESTGDTCEKNGKNDYGIGGIGL